MVLEAVLKARGWAVDSFATAEDAWVACQAQAYDLAVLDWMLPGKTGLELCQQIRALDWGDRTLVLVETARSRTSDLQAVLEAGADDYLSKPLDPDLLDVRLAIAERGVTLLRERKRNEEAKTRALSRLQTVHEIDQAILGSHSAMEIVESALGHLQSLTGLAEVHAVELDFETGEAVVTAVASSDAASVQVGSRIPLERFPVESLRRGVTSVLEPPNPTYERPAGHALQSLQDRTMTCFPLIVRGELIGSLNLAKADGSPLDEEQASMAHEVATSLAVGIQNSRLTAELTRLAAIDELTGAYNRRKLFDLGAREVLRSQRFGRPLSAMMLDIDHFKQVNDRWGHSVGDRVLLCVAHCCNRTVREVDVLGRYGGEEFAILLPEACADEAVEVAERVRSEVEGLVIPTDGGALSVTVSIGVARLGDDANDLRSLLARADAAMYEAKRAGRNTVRLFTERLALDSGPDVPSQQPYYDGH